MALSCATSSGLVAADAAVTTMPGVLHSVILVGGSDTATVVVYDNASAASGTVLAKLVCGANTTAEFHSTQGVAFNNGIYVDVTGTGAGTIVHYTKG